MVEVYVGLDVSDKSTHLCVSLARKDVRFS